MWFWRVMSRIYFDGLPRGYFRCSLAVALRPILLDEKAHPVVEPDRKREQASHSLRLGFNPAATQTEINRYGRR